MKQKYLIILILFILPLAVYSQQILEEITPEPEEIEVVQPAPPKARVIRGVVDEVAPDGSFIVVSGTKILTTRVFLYESFIEKGDEVEITVKNSAQGLEAVDYDYTYNPKPLRVPAPAGIRPPENAP